MLFDIFIAKILVYMYTALQSTKLVILPVEL